MICCTYVVLLIKATDTHTYFIHQVVIFKGEVMQCENFMQLFHFYDHRFFLEVFDVNRLFYLFIYFYLFIFSDFIVSFLFRRIFYLLMFIFHLVSDVINERVIFLLLLFNHLHFHIYLYLELYPHILFINFDYFFSSLFFYFSVYGRKLSSSTIP